MTPQLGVNVAGIRMANPIMTASGCCGYGQELAEVFPGVRPFLDRLSQRGLKMAVLTRNSRQSAQAVLSRLALASYFSPAIFQG